MDDSGQSIDEAEETRIDEVATDLFEAMGDPDDWSRFELERVTASGCGTTLGLEPGLGQGEAWYARKAHDLLASGAPYDDDAMFDTARDRLREQGWEVREYRGGATGTLRNLDALREDVTVRLTSPPVRVTVTSGPCAREVLSDNKGFTPVAE